MASLHIVCSEPVRCARTSTSVELHSEAKEIPCVDEVDKMKGTFKWTKKAIQAIEKLNTDWTGERSYRYSDCH